MVRLIREIPSWRRTRMESVEVSGLRRVDLNEIARPVDKVNEQTSELFQGYCARWWPGENSQWKSLLDPVVKR